MQMHIMWYNRNANDTQQTLKGQSTCNTALTSLLQNNYLKSIAVIEKENEKKKKKTNILNQQQQQTHAH